MSFKDYFQQRLLLEANPEKRVEFLYNKYARKIDDLWMKRFSWFKTFSDVTANHRALSDKTENVVNTFRDKKIREFIQNIVFEVDPTQGEYSDWIIKNYLKLPKEYTERWKEDASQITSDLIKYIKYKKYFKQLTADDVYNAMLSSNNMNLEIVAADTKNILQNANRLNDINSITSFNHLFQVLKYLRSFIQKDQEKEAYNKAAKDVEKVYESDEWLILIPKTKEASCLYGKDTRWCTAAENSHNYFDSYNRKGPLYIFIEKETQAKWQFHFQEEQYMDAEDSQIDLVEFINDNPELKDIILDLAEKNESTDVIMRLAPERIINKILTAHKEGKIDITHKELIRDSMRIALKVGHIIPELVNDVQRVIYFAPNDIHMTVNDWQDLDAFILDQSRTKNDRLFALKVLEDDYSDYWHSNLSYDDSYWEWLNDKSKTLLKEYIKNKYDVDVESVEEMEDIIDENDDDYIKDLLTSSFDRIYEQCQNDARYNAVIKCFTHVFGDNYKWIDSRLHFTGISAKQVEDWCSTIENFSSSTHNNNIVSLRYFYGELAEALEDEHELKTPDYDREMNNAYPSEHDKNAESLKQEFNEYFGNEIDVGESPEEKKEREIMKQGQKELDLNNFKQFTHNKIGKHNKVPDKKFDRKELKKGEEIEHEHTDSKKIAKKIAKDHLSEIPDYYERLDKMEKKAKKELDLSQKGFKQFFVIKEESAPAFKTFYHVTRSENTPHILRDGLTPQVGARSQLYGEKGDGGAVYLFPTKADAEDAVMNWMGDEFDEAESLDLLKIMVPETFKLDRDPNSFEIVSRYGIPKEYIYLVQTNI